MQEPTTLPESASPARKRPWLRWFTATLIAALLLAVFHAPILRAVGRLCIYEDEPGSVEWVVLAGGTLSDGRRLYEENGLKGFLLVPYRQSRVVRLQLAPSSLDLFKQELRAAGIPQDAIATLPGEVRSNRQLVEILHTWLETHSGTQIQICCHPFQSRRLAWQLGHGLTREERSRVRLRPSQTTSYDESTWWRSRDGVLVTTQELLRLGLYLARGEDEEEGREWNPEEYERHLPRAPTPHSASAVAVSP